MKTANQRLCPLPVSSIACAVSATVLLSLSTPSHAFQIDTGNPELSATWDNTIKYSNAWRVNKLDHKVAVGPGTSNSNPNLDDGDRNFDRGLISNRLDVLSEFDIKYKDVGARLSAASVVRQCLRPRQR